MHTDFVNEIVTKEEDIIEARATQSKMNYSALESDMTDLKESL